MSRINRLLSHLLQRIPNMEAIKAVFFGPDPQAQVGLVPSLWVMVCG